MKVHCPICCMTANVQKTPISAGRVEHCGQCGMHQTSGALSRDERPATVTIDQDHAHEWLPDPYEPPLPKRNAA